MNEVMDDQLPDGLASYALQAAEYGVVVIDGEDPERRISWVNPAFEKLSGFERIELVGNTLRILQGGDLEQAAIGELRTAMEGERGCSVLLRSHRPDGAVYWNALRVTPWRDDLGKRWWIGYARDMSAQREMEIMLGRRSDELDIARHRGSEIETVDRLTGLQNEHSFELALELSWFSCARDRRPLSLFLFAPDFFDMYVETFGRVAGDSCLRMLARSVGAAFRRASDVAARLGEAEFAALGTNMEQDLIESHARRVCERVRALAIRNPHAPMTRVLTLSAVVLTGQPGQAPDWRALLAQARRTMAASQLAGTQQLVVQDYGSEVG